MRHAFRLQLRSEAIEAYEAAHQRVWPDLLQLLKRVGICNYSIFRLDVDLFFYMEVDDFDAAWRAIGESEVNRRWQKDMARFFAPMSAVNVGQRFPMMQEVFYMA